MPLVFATSNKHKLYEIKEAIGGRIEILGLHEAGINEDIPETGATLEENTLIKAKYIFNKYHLNCFADDTGLEIEVLNGRPGVYSARYAGKDCNFGHNIKKVLSEMLTIENRKARFRCVIALILDGKIDFFEGIVNGRLLYEKRGQGGFGYDPIFVPEGYDQTFAEMPVEEKNKISHRGIAVSKLVEYLTSTSFKI
ncbi:MAG: non-canonical purine NTP diphosphatase [Bacteroidota bacterium]